MTFWEFADKHPVVITVAIIVNALIGIAWAQAYAARGPK